MTEKDIQTVSLDELRAMKAKGELKNPEGTQTESELPAEFWKEAKLLDRAQDKQGGE